MHVAVEITLIQGNNDHEIMSEKNHKGCFFSFFTFFNTVQILNMGEMNVGGLFMKLRPSGRKPVKNKSAWVVSKI